MRGCGKQEGAGSKSCACKSRVLRNLLHCVINTFVCGNATFLLCFISLPGADRAPLSRSNPIPRATPARETTTPSSPRGRSWSRSIPLHLRGGSALSLSGCSPLVKRERAVPRVRRPPARGVGGARGQRGSGGGDGALRCGREAAGTRLDPQGGGGGTAGVTGPGRGERLPQRSGRTGQGRPGPT